MSTDADDTKWTNRAASSAAGSTQKGSGLRGWARAVNDSDNKWGDCAVGRRFGRPGMEGYPPGGKMEDKLKELAVVTWLLLLLVVVVVVSWG